jgi:hypothetical protein
MKSQGTRRSDRLRGHDPLPVLHRPCSWAGADSCLQRAADGIGLLETTGGCRATDQASPRVSGRNQNDAVPRTPALARARHKLAGGTVRPPGPGNEPGDALIGIMLASRDAICSRVWCTRREYAED